MKITAVCGMIILAAGELFAAIPDKPIGIEAIKKIVIEVDSLASNGIPSSIVFAKELAQVLSKHGVRPPENIVLKQSPKQPVPDPNQDELERIYESTHEIYEFCSNSTWWMEDPNYVVPVPLRNDLLMTLVNHCPHILCRLEVAKWLAEQVVPDEDGPTIFPDVSAQMADNACLSAINHVLSMAPEDEILYFWSLAFGLDLTYNHIMLAGMAGQQPNRESVNNMFAGLASRADAVLELTTDKDHIDAIGRIRKQLQEIEKNVDLLLQMLQLKKELEPVIKAFIEAVSKEDKALASKYVLEEVASHITKEESLCSLLCAGSGELKGQKIKEVKYLFLVTLTDPDNIQKPQFVRASVFLEVNTEDGKSYPLKPNLPVTRTSNGWLIGEKKFRM